MALFFFLFFINGHNFFTNNRKTQFFSSWYACSSKLSILSNVLSNGSLQLGRKTLRDEALNSTAMSLVSSNHVLLDPGCHIMHLGEVISRSKLARVEGRECQSKSNIIRRVFSNDIVSDASGSAGRVCQQSEENPAGISPALGEFGSEHLRVAQCFGQRNNGRLSVDGPCQFVCFLQDKWRINLSKDFFVYLVGMFDKVICSVASFQLPSNEMEESNEADLERISWGSL
jgi:hypothetical protein